MTNRSQIALVLGCVAIGFGGCETIVHEPTYMSQNRVQVEEKKVFEEVAISDLDDAYIASLSQKYYRYGDGGIDLTVTYDPRSKKSTAMTASSEAARISKAFRRHGMSDVSTNIVPVKGQGSHAKALISYQAYEALAPEDCTTMPGFDDLNVDNDEDYKIGCTKEMIFARQIARPKDLKGRPQEDPTSDGRRAANIVEGYRTGQPNEPLGGESASE